MTGAARKEDGRSIACPACGSGRSVVAETRSHAGHKLRRRRCVACKTDYVTSEIVVSGTMREAMEEVGRGVS